MPNLNTIGLELAVLGVGLALLLLDLWTPIEKKRNLGYAAVFAVGLILVASFFLFTPDVSGATSLLGRKLPLLSFGEMYVVDELALFFKRLFLLSALFVLVMAIEFAEKLETGIAEYYSLVLFALAGMMFAASANHFALLFVSLELVTVTFYVLTSFQRRRVKSLEAGVKYLILGALSSGFLVYGIALVYGASGTLEFSALRNVPTAVAEGKLLMLGLLFVFVGLGFKLAVVPFQIWAPDVYQGAPAPTTAFLAVGSKATGLVLLLRVLDCSPALLNGFWSKLLMTVAGVTILYGTLCAIPQRNLKRLLGYSSIANAGFLLLGVSTLSGAGLSAILYYIAGYLFTVLIAFTVICLALQESDIDDIDALSGLSQRSPFLAMALTVSMVSLAGLPPLAGFFGKFLLLKSVALGAASNTGYYWLLAVALAAVATSLYYYFGVVRAIYWGQGSADLSPIRLSAPVKVSLLLCLLGIFWLGTFPNCVLNLSQIAAAVLRF
jgi:NADH-quinone oxidoreductase subunit N